MKNLKTILFVVLAGLLSIPVLAQKEIKLKTIHNELIVDVSVKKAWDVINSYGDVGSYHSSIASSKPINGSEVEGSMGCERQCYIQSNKKDIYVDETIIEFVDESHYKYVAVSEQFPAKAFYNTFGVKKNEQGKTVIFVTTEYRLKPGFMTGIAKGKLSKGNNDALLFYKHYMETGEKNGNPEEIREKYNS